MSETVEDATHELSCRHSLNSRSGYDYSMPCIVKKIVRNGWLKILLFGERAQKDAYHKSRIRYVKASRVSERTEEAKP